MKKDTHKLIKMAFITSPILAIYNLAPISLFFKSGMTNSRVEMIPQFDPPVRMLMPVLFISVNALILWLFNIWLSNESKKIGLETGLRYAFSFLFTFAFIALLQSITKGVRPPLETLGSLQFYPFIGSAANNAFILIMIDLIVNRERRASLEIEKARLESTNIKSRHELLKQQIQPHFLFNALNTLKLLINRDHSSATAYTVKLSTFLRASIADGLEEKISVKRDLDIFLDFMELQMVRFPDAIIILDEIPQSVFNTRLFPPFTLQILAENAIKHSEFSKGNPLKVRMRVDDEVLSFSNNHTPRKVGKESVGIGLNNLSERFKILSGEGIEVEQNEALFIVRLKMIEQ